MKCSFCGWEFWEEEARASCEGCSLARHRCRLIRCPNCGYETPTPPRWIEWIRQRVKGKTHGSE